MPLYLKLGKRVSENLVYLTLAPLKGGRQPSDFFIQYCQSIEHVFLIHILKCFRCLRGAKWYFVHPQVKHLRQNLVSDCLRILLMTHTQKTEKNHYSIRKKTEYNSLFLPNEFRPKKRD